MTKSQLWDEYALTQKQLADGARVDDRAWGLEAGLNSLLWYRTDLAEDGKLRRVIESGARGERRHSLIFRTVARPTDIIPPGLDSRLDARRRLFAMKAQVSESDWTLLQLLGEGHEYRDVAARQGASAAALRVRVHRLRRSLGDMQPTTA